MEPMEEVSHFTHFLLQQPDIGDFMNNRPKKTRKVTKPKKVKSQADKDAGKIFLGGTGFEIPLQTCNANSAILCREQCRLACSTRFTISERAQIFSSYCKLDANGKATFLFDTMESFDPKRVSSTGERFRMKSFRYFLPINGERRQICKTGMINVLGVGKKKLELIRNQVSLGLPVAQTDMRGQHSNRPNRTPEADVMFAKEHIKMFPAEASPYSNDNRMYLSPELSVNKMFELYTELCTIKERTPVLSSRYRHIFNTYFNLGFGTPKNDTCQSCMKGHNSAEHTAIYQAAYEQQKLDKEFATKNENVYYITFDFEKTLPLPKISSDRAIYLRHLWLYNLGVHMVDNSHPKGQGFFHLWTENEGLRGCDEIGSCLIYFFDSLPCKGEKHLIAWSDSYAGEDDFFNIIFLWQYCLFKNIFQSVEHKFPIIGHTILDSDRDFTIVEKTIQKYPNIYSVEEYIDIMNEVRRSTPFRITRMGDKFIDIKNIPEALGLVYRKKSLDGCNVNYRDARWISIDKFGEVKLRYSFNETEEWTVIDLLDYSQKSQSLKINILVSKPICCLPIPGLKFDDLQQQILSIPPDKRTFYNRLLKAQ